MSSLNIDKRAKKSKIKEDMKVEKTIFKISVYRSLTRNSLFFVSD
jgi:hypothetical protein